MFGISYLSSENRRTIDKLERAATVSSPPEAANLRLKVMELQNQCKSYQECDLEELSDLRVQIFEKYVKLASIGKSEGAGQFQMMITQIEERMQQILLDRQLKAEKAKQATPLEDRDARQPRSDRLEPPVSPTGPTKIKPSRNRWTVGGSAKT